MTTTTKTSAETDRLRAADLCDELKAHRFRLGLTQADMARLFGVDTMTISKWENGRLSPRPWTLELIREVVASHIPATDLVGQLRQYPPIQVIRSILIDGRFDRS